MSETPLRTKAKRRGRAAAIAALTSGAIALTLLSPGFAQADTPTAGASATASSGTSAAAKQRATFGVRPATKGFADDRLEFNYQIAPGGSYSDTFELDNYSAAALTIQVLSADLGNTETGDLSVGLRTDKAVDLGAWITLPPTATSVVVAKATAKGPGRVQIPFRLKIPTNATPGDHSAAIVAVLSTLGKNSKGQNVRLDQRVASRVFVRVPGPLHPRLTVDGLHVTYDATLNPFGQGVAHATYTVHNLGNTRLGVKQAISVTGWFGLKSTASAVPTIKLLLPGKSATVTVTVPQIQPAGHEHLAVALSPLVLDGDKAISVSVQTAGHSFWAVPWTLIALVIAVIVLLVLGLRRRGRPRPPSAHTRRGPRDPSDPQGPTGGPVADHPITAGVPVPLGSPSTARVVA